MPPTPQSPGEIEERLEIQLERVERVLAFAGNFVTARKRELAPIFQRRGFGPSADELVQRVNQLSASVEKGRQFVGLAKGQPPRLALVTLQNFDFNALHASARGLTTLAEAVKAEPSVRAALAGAAGPARTGELRAAQTGPLTASGAGTGRLIDAVRNWIAPPAVTAVPAVAVEEVPEAPEKVALEGAIAFVAKVLKHVGARLKVVNTALDACGVPGLMKPWPQIEARVPEYAREHRLDPAMTQWAYHVADMFTGNPNAVRLASGAVTQWKQATEQMTAAEAVQQQMAAGPRERIPLYADRINLAKFKSSVYPLGHLHLTFKGMPPLSDLFPPPPGARVG